MIVSSYAYRIWLPVAVFLVLMPSAPLLAQHTELPESIRLALVRYAELSPLAVTWTQTTEATALGREKIAPEVLSRILSEGCSVQQFAFRDGRIYVRRETQGASSWPPRTDEVAFDGNLLFAAHNLFYAGDFKHHDPKERPYLHKWLLKNDDPEASYFRDDYFHAAGVRLPERTKELMSPRQPQSELLALLADGGRIEEIGSTDEEGRQLIRVQIANAKSSEKNSPVRRFDFYLDPERGAAVRRLEIRDDAGLLLSRSDCTEFEQIGGRRLWMPRTCRVEVYTHAEAQVKDGPTSDVYPSPLYVKTIQVNAFDAQPWPEERFQLRYTTPGVYVNDASFPEVSGKDGVFYQIPTNPQRLDEVIALKRAFYQAWQSADKKSRPLRVLFLVLNGLGLVGFTVYLCVRQRQKASCS